MKRATAWSFAVQLVCAAAGSAQSPPDPPLTGFVYVVATQDSKDCQQCDAYGTGTCMAGTGSCSGAGASAFPYAGCEIGSTMRLLSAHYCDVFPLPDGYCYTYLCFGGGNFRENVALGRHAGEELDSGSYRAEGNTAIGASALASAKGSNWVAGWNNTAVGARALMSSVSGSGDVAVGATALASLVNPDGSGANVAVGSVALQNLAQGRGNIAVGGSAGFGLSNGSNNIYLGGGPGWDTTENDTMRLGSTQTSTFIAGIRNATLSDDPQPVYVDGNGQLGLYSSPERAEGPADSSRTASRGSDAVAALQRKIRAQDERIAALERQLQELAVELRAISMRLAARTSP